PRARTTRALALSIVSARCLLPCPVYSVQYGIQMNKHADPTVPLSRERILGAALDVIDREGLSALSMRRLAQELDVWPMSVYRYFQDKDALLDAMAADLIDQLPDLAPDAPWRERMHALLEAAAGRLAESPGLAARLPRAFL